MNNVKSLHEKIATSLPFPWWFLLIIFGPLYPFILLTVYCIDWVSQCIYIADFEADHRENKD